MSTSRLREQCRNPKEAVMRSAARIVGLALSLAMVSLSPGPADAQSTIHGEREEKRGNDHGRVRRLHDREEE